MCTGYTPATAAPTASIPAKGLPRFATVHDVEGNCVPSLYAADTLEAATCETIFHDVEGNCVPSLYAADTLEAATCETIFHDIPVTARRKTVPRTLIQSRTHGRLQVRRDLQLVSLRGPDLRRWRISRNSLITPSPSLYRDTARWAEAIHHQFPDVDGLLWTSSQCDPDTAYLFYGDRVAAGDLRIVQARDGLLDVTFLSDVRQAGQRSGISIAV